MIEKEKGEVPGEISYAGKVLASKLLQSISSPTQKKPQEQQRKTRNVFHKNAQCENSEASSDNLAADVDLVAFGVSRTEPDQMKAFLVGKGLEIENVECMTKPELVAEKKIRSKAMRVTVKASEHKKAMNLDMWPFRVGVRLYKTQPRRRNTENESWSSQAGGIAMKMLEAGESGRADSSTTVKPRTPISIHLEARNTVVTKEEISSRVWETGRFPGMLQ